MIKLQKSVGPFSACVWVCSNQDNQRQAPIRDTLTLGSQLQVDGL